MDPVSRREFWTILSELRSQGITIVVSTPYMDEAHLCDELLFLHKGQIVRQGKPEALLATYPHPLYKVSSASTLLTVAQNAALPAGVALMYPEGGAIHVAVPGAERSPSEVLSVVKPYCPMQKRLKEYNLRSRTCLFVC